MFIIKVFAQVKLILSVIKRLDIKVEGYYPPNRVTFKLYDLFCSLLNIISSFFKNGHSSTYLTEMLYDI